MKVFGLATSIARSIAKNNKVKDGLTCIVGNKN